MRSDRHRASARSLSMPIVVEPTDDRIAQAVARLRQGSVIAFPTETVYGLGAATFNEAGLRKVYELKDRPAGLPLIAHVADVEGAERVTGGWDDRCSRLAARFWPGPLALVLPLVRPVGLFVPLPLTKALASAEAN